MSPWARFEANCILGILVFLAGGAVGLLAAAIGIGQAPAVVPAVSVEEAGRIALLLSCLIGSAIALVACARGIIAGAWGDLEKALGDKVKAQPLREWINGSGLLLALSVLIVPFYAAELFAIYLFGPMLAATLVFGAVRGATSARPVLGAYLSIKKAIGPVKGKGRIRILPAILSGLVAAWSVTAIIPTVQSAREKITASTLANLKTVLGEIEAREKMLPEVERIHTARVAVEATLFAAETASRTKGRSSDVEVAQSKARMLTVEAEAVRAIAEAREVLDRLRREKIELEHRLAGLRSAAPALVK